MREQSLIATEEPKLNRLVSVFVAVAALALLAGPISPANAGVKKPKPGNYKHDDEVSLASGGKLKVDKKRKKVKKLVLKANDEDQERCGIKKISTQKPLKLKKYPRGWSYAKLPKGSIFFEPKPTTFSTDNSATRGTLELYFDEKGRSASGVLSYDECRIDFAFNK